MIRNNGEGPTRSEGHSAVLHDVATKRAGQHSKRLKRHDSGNETRRFGDDATDAQFLAATAARNAILGRILIRWQIELGKLRNPCSDTDLPVFSARLSCLPPPCRVVISNAGLMLLKLSSRSRPARIQHS